MTSSRGVKKPPVLTGGCVTRRSLLLIVKLVLDAFVSEASFFADRFLPSL